MGEIIMANTLGYHYVKSAYGMWMPGDNRGHWSEAWDEKIGYIEPHTLHQGDPTRQRMATERMKHEPVHLTEEMIGAVVVAISKCITVSAGGLAIAAAAIESTHVHLLIGKKIFTQTWIILL